MANAQAFLTATAASLRRLTVRLDRLDGSLVEEDIAARRIEADIGLAFAMATDRIMAALKATPSNRLLDKWVKEHCGCDIQTMRRRKRLHKLWKQYEQARRQLGQCGQTGLEFALSLVMERTRPVTNNRGPIVRSVTRTNSRSASQTAPIRNDRVQFITGDALIELPKLMKKSVQCVVTSPPYWPTKRAYSGHGIGFEPTLEQYIGNLVTIFREAREVLKDDGILWVVMDDSYSRAGGNWDHDPKSPAMRGLPHQDSRDVRDAGNLLLIPTRFALAMQDDGWFLRSEIIWSKTNLRPESMKDRPTKNHEKILMFTKQRRYFYDADPVRVPLVGQTSSIPGRQKAGMNRGDGDRSIRIFNNPMGRNSGSVWEIPPSNYRGDHSAPFPPDLVRQCLLASCPEDSLVLDPFGGAATTAMVACELGHRAISIEISQAYSTEGRERLEAA